ncbi:MAG TPA: hypothetical protein VHL78_00240 [Actinomycetota bacterium]|nr:hypothetical protein [Actinomycetota bacterium]
MKRVTMALVALATVVAACARSPSGAPDDVARLVPLGGTVEVVRGTDALVATEAVTLSKGDVVRTGEEGAARLELPGEQSVELGADSVVEVDVGAALRLQRGRLLGVAGDGLQVVAGEDRVQARNAAFTVQRSFGTRVGVYRGGVAVDGLGQPIPALRRLTILAGGNLPRGLEPLVVEPDDPWDDRFLGPAIDVGLGIDRLRRGLAAQLGGRDGEDAVADLLERYYDRAVVRSLLEQASRAELADLVVAARLAVEAAEDSGASSGSVLEDILALRGEGAQWIVIVAQWGVIGQGLLDALARLTGIIARAVAPPPSPGPGTSPSDGPSSGGPTTGPGSGGGGDDDGGDGGGGGGGNGGNGGGGDPDPPPPPPPPECDNAVECVVDDVLDGVASL